MTYISDRLRVSKSDILDPSSSSAIITQARAETHVIDETKRYFQSHGVNLDSITNTERCDNVIVIKNIAYGTPERSILQLFEEYGQVTRFLLPPSGITAIVVFQYVHAAKAAFKSLSYRKLKDSVLFLEWAPKALISEMSGAGDQMTRHDATGTTQDLSSTEGTLRSTTLYVRNINFSSSSDEFRNLFHNLDGFVSAIIRSKPDPKDNSRRLSMGYGFVEFRTHSQAMEAMEAMQGYVLRGHGLVIKKSQSIENERTQQGSRAKVGGENSKIIVKNLPFEVSKSDVRALFGSYGQLRTLRIPKKVDRSSKGYAFVEFATSQDAENAMESLKHTHLLGRRLVLQFAAVDLNNPEEEVGNLQSKVNTQINVINMQKMTTSKRRKIMVEDVL